MNKDIERTVVYNKAIIWTSLRSAAKASRFKLPILVKDCTVTYYMGTDWCEASFIDPFTDKPVTVKRKKGAILDFKGDRHPSDIIQGFEGFTDRPKRTKKPEKEVVMRIYGGYGEPAPPRLFDIGPVIRYPLAVKHIDLNFTVTEDGVGFAGTPFKEDKDEN
jgi:hypothetical protein